MKKTADLKKQRGFTLIEFIIVMSIVALISGAVGISVDQANSDVIQMNTALQALADFRFAQETAMSTNRPVTFSVNPGADSYQAVFADDNSFLISPLDGQNLSVTFPDIVDMISTGMSGNAVTFTNTGEPTIAGSTFSGSVSVMLIDSWKHVVIFSSGYSALQDNATGGNGCGGGVC